ncbi:dolichyl-phosphate beta-glucosyltransferase [Lignoscripta atroalba]|nr:dolichyl-phosphate beta-glucosyltransferase [Lignoscripta atroalba]
MDLIRRTIAICQSVPLPLLVLFLLTTLVGVVVLSYLALFIVAPIPRAPLSHERTFRCIEPDGMISDAKRLPCWQDMYNTHKRTAQRNGDFSNSTRIDVEEAEVFMSLVVPAYNEEERLGIMLTEAVEYLQREYEGTEAGMNPLQGNGVVKQRAKDMKERGANGHTHAPSSSSSSEGWEILIVSDGSTDKTVQTALQFARGLGAKRCASIRVVSLQENRGKGGAVTHGMRHVRGKYAIFADADGASKFEDLGKLLRACKQIEDKEGRGVAVGSRAHLVGSEAVVKRSFLRNLLMHSFHFLLRILTPPATAAIRDTQCGFKLFSRPSLPYIIPYMHSEGWIFDVEMLMLAESAGIPVAEVPIGWKEVKGSKLNVLWDSLGMAWGLAVLRAAWGCGVYRRS